MICAGKRLRLWLACAWLLALAGTSWAEGPPTESLLQSGSDTASSPSSMPTTGQPQTGQWESFDSLWETLKEELSASEADLQTLQDSLARLQTEARELQSSYLELMELYEKSERARMTERETARLAEEAALLRLWDAEQDRDRWRIAAIVAAVAGVAGWLMAIF